MVQFIRDYFIIIPIILLTITMILIIIFFKRKKKYVKTEGVIIDFYENWRNETHAAHDGKITLKCRDGNVSVDVCSENILIPSDDYRGISPIITYKVDDKVYNIIGNFYSTRMKKGDKFDLMYNPSNPKQVKIKNAMIFSIIILSILSIASIIALLILRKVL